MLPPEQIVAEFTVTLGFEITETVPTLVPVQPFCSPVTVKVVVVEGVVTMVAVVAPVFQV